ncbi:MAG: SsrA-binding protein SmpB [Candidatus Magasanikbacteria bacterium]
MTKEKVYAQNKKARHRYEILENYEAGIDLEGHEVKAIRSGNASLKGSFVTFTEGEAFINNMHIGQYKYSRDIIEYDPERKRRLLLKRSQINYLRGKTSQPGLTVVPLSLYNSGQNIKAEIALVKGKTKHSKKEDLKEKDQKRRAQRAAKERSTRYGQQ